MKLIYLHGAPATGKLTIAREIAKQIPARLSDNHAAIDLARTVFDYDTESFWSLVKATRMLLLDHAARSGLPLMIMTSCYSDPHDRSTFKQYETILNATEAKLCPVFLRCDPAELTRRVVGQDRSARGKIASTDGLERFVSRYNMVPVPHADVIEIATDRISAVRQLPESSTILNWQAIEPDPLATPVITDNSSTDCR